MGSAPQVLTHLHWCEQVADMHPDQFAPFLAFGCDMHNHYPGTLFRFPLRTPEMALRSRISKQVSPCMPFGYSLKPGCALNTTYRG
jgi:hypothetical protein